MEMPLEMDGVVSILQMENTEGRAAMNSRIVLHAAY